MIKKKVWIEALRIFALFWVLYDHTGGYGYTLFSNSEVSLSFAEKTVNFLLLAFCRISVPLFLMISGALLLGRSEPVKKNVKRMSRIVILIMLTAVANCVYFQSIHHEYTQNIHSFLDFIKELYGGTNLCTYYLWLYLGFLLCVPLMREIVKRRELVVYSAVLYVVLMELLSVFELWFNWASFNLKAYGGIFAIYYICPMLGYWIDSSETIFTRKTLEWVNGLAAVSLGFNILIAVWAWESRAITWVLMPVVLSTCLFYDAKYFSLCAAKERFCQKHFYPLLEKVILALSPQTLGTFLLSGVLIWKCFWVYTALSGSISHTAAALVWALVCMIFCQAVTAVLRLLPFMKKLL